MADLSIMTIWICATCGIEHADTAMPPEHCEICEDDRQYVPRSGQRWTSQSELAVDRVGSVTELEPELYAVRVQPRVGIGQRGLLVRTPGGNLLWEPPGYLDDALVGQVRDLGGVAAISASHPHLVGAAVSWSEAFDHVPFYVNAYDRRWIRRPDPAVTLWSGTQPVLPGITLVQCGGHFPGSSVAHWTAGAAGLGALLTGDTLFVNTNFDAVSFMRSYPNLLPLPERLVRQIVHQIAPLAFDRLYGGFDEQVLSTGARQDVASSAERYIGWLRDEIRDPFEQRDP
jgi:glyoxylase-like metal-dependent hydrolase (beta-lactamase superfamily II)